MFFDTIYSLKQYISFSVSFDISSFLKKFIYNQEQRIKVGGYKVAVQINVDLPLGENTIEFKEALGYADLACRVNVGEVISCVSVNGVVADCARITPPYISFPPFVSPAEGAIKGWLKEAVANFNSWVEEQGGASGMYGNKNAVFEIKDGYAGIEDLGFIVTKDNVFSIKDYYAGIT